MTSSAEPRPDDVPRSVLDLLVFLERRRGASARLTEIPAHLVEPTVIAFCKVHELVRDARFGVDDLNSGRTIHDTGTIYVLTDAGRRVATRRLLETREKDRIQPAAPAPTGAPPMSRLPLTAASESFLSALDLSTMTGIDAEKLRKRLERWRPMHDDGWYEVNDRKANQPKYLYNVGAVRELIDEMRADASDAASVQRPSSS